MESVESHSPAFFHDSEGVELQCIFTAEKVQSLRDWEARSLQPADFIYGYSWFIHFVNVKKVYKACPVALRGYFLTNPRNY